MLVVEMLEKLLVNLNGNIKMNKKEEIFTIGDKCEKGIISSFSVFDNNLIITYDNGYTQPLKNAIKSKVLFRTEDGVDIFEGDICYYVRPEIKYVEKIGVPFVSVDEVRKNYKYFSTKEKAEEYILMNKPCLSVADICTYFDGQLSGCSNLFYLKKLAKSKLNESKD